MTEKEMSLEEREIRKLTQTLKNIEEELAQAYHEFELQYGETAREILEEEMVSSR